MNVPLEQTVDRITKESPQLPGISVVGFRVGNFKFEFGILLSMANSENWSHKLMGVIPLNLDYLVLCLYCIYIPMW